MRFSRLVLYVATLFVAGCASTQLNYNTLEIAGTIDDLLASQIAHNLSKFLRDPNAIPSQVAIPSGSVTTTAQVGSSWSDPLTKAVTLAHSATTPVSVLSPSAGLTPSASDQWSQNWSLAPVADSDQIRRLAALYRYATNPRSVDLCRDYPLVETQGSTMPGPKVSTQSSEDENAWGAVAHGGPGTSDKEDLYRAYLRAFSKPGKPAKHEWAAKRSIEHIESGGAANKTDSYEKDWSTALTGDNLSSYGTYLQQHANTDAGKPHVTYARDRIAQLLEAQAKNPPPPPPPPNNSNPITSIETSDGSITVTATDSLFLKEPSCILCSKKANLKNISRSPANVVAQNSCKRNTDSDLYVNPRLTTYWLIYSTPDGAFFQVTPDGPAPVSGEGLFRIGTAGGITLYTRNTRAYNEFILFILEATAQGSTSGQSGKNTASGRGGPQGGQIPAGATIPLTSP
jgi:hypothetical protein